MFQAVVAVGITVGAMALPTPSAEAQNPSSPGCARPPVTERTPAGNRHTTESTPAENRHTVSAEGGQSPPGPTSGGGMRRGFWAGGGGALTSVGVEIEQRGAATRFTENPNLLQGGVAIFWR